MILCSPTQMHAAQAFKAMDASRQKENRPVCMVDHTRHFLPPHQWVHNKIKAGKLNVQQINAQTCFFLRKNINAKHDVSAVAIGMNGIGPEDRAFIAAIQQSREPNSSVAQIFDCYHLLGELKQQLDKDA